MCTRPCGKIGVNVKAIVRFASAMFIALTCAGCANHNGAAWPEGLRAGAQVSVEVDRGAGGIEGVRGSVVGVEGAWIKLMWRKGEKDVVAWFSTLAIRRIEFLSEYPTLSK